MKHIVTITFEVDPTEYSQYSHDEEDTVEALATDEEPPACDDTSRSVIELVKGMLKEEVDYPDDCTITITCENLTDSLKVE